MSDVDASLTRPSRRARTSAKFATTFASLQVRNFRLYFLGQLVSLAGTWMQQVAQGWLVLQLTDSAFTTRTIAGVRRRGWSASIAEREPGVASISAPVRDRRGKVVAAISISGPAERIGRSPGTRLSRPLLNAAAELERKL